LGLRFFVPVLLALALASAAQAIVLSADPGTQNTGVPGDDPGWIYVGRMGPTGVYMGYGWVLTANHNIGLSSATDFLLDGSLYPMVAGSVVEFQDDVTSGKVDLAAYRIYPFPDPDLSPLEIRSVTYGGSTQAIMISDGPERDSSGPPDADGCWTVTNLGVKRWGPNEIAGTGTIAYGNGDFGGPYDYHAVSTDFTTTDDSLGHLGDSGGGLFCKQGSTWELCGILTTRSVSGGQASNEACLGNLTYSVDLQHFRDDVLAIVRPCDDGEDNDEDGDTDFPADEECSWIGDLSEQPACSDGYDNDANGLTDFPDDPGCFGLLDTSESPAEVPGVPTLSPVPTALLVLLLSSSALHAIRRRGGRG
jgi:hypothetical protein